MPAHDPCPCPTWSGWRRAAHLGLLLSYRLANISQRWSPEHQPQGAFLRLYGSLEAEEGTT